MLAILFLVSAIILYTSIIGRFYEIKFQNKEKRGKVNERHVKKQIIEKIISILIIGRKESETLEFQKCC